MTKKRASKKRKEELLGECRKANLSLPGTTAELRERPQVFRTSESEKEDMSARAELATSAGVNRLSALVFEDINVNPSASDEDAAEVCEAGLKKALDEEGLTVLRVASGEAAANVKGQSILEMLQDQKEEIAELHKRDTQLALDLANALAQAEAHRQDLIRSSYGYSRLRSRFLSCFKRKMRIETEQDRRIISFGNNAAHGGDAHYDASLYEDGTRTDDDAFERLYGLDYKRVRRIRRFSH